MKRQPDYRILFVCHGNICRSPMAEFVCRNMAAGLGGPDWLTVASAATSTEEIGRDIHPGTRRKLQEAGVPFSPRAAVQMTRSDYGRYDYLLGMDWRNLANMRRIAGGDPEGKIRLLLEFAGEDGEIADPWYTGNFEETYEDVVRGCQGLLRFLKQQKGR